MLTPMDEYPVHQLPQPMADVGSSDRNFYDRCYLNAHDRTGEHLSGSRAWATTRTSAPRTPSS